MNIADVRPGQRVRLTIDRSRYDEADYAYLMRQGKYGEGKYLALGPTVDGSILTVFAVLHDGVRLINEQGLSVYFAKANELEEA